MAVDTSSFFAVFSYNNLFWITIELAILAFAALYFIFALIVVRQVRLMTTTLITEVSPLLKALSILFAGFSLGMTFLFIGLFFG